MLFSYGYGQQWNRGLQKCWRIDNNFDTHAARAIWGDAHSLMERIRCFMQTH
jgi:hypothetical protein